MRHTTDGIRTALVPSVQIPGEDVAFEEVADTKLRPDTALFKVALIRLRSTAEVDAETIFLSGEVPSGEKDETISAASIFIKRA